MKGNVKKKLVIAGATAAALIIGSVVVLGFFGYMLMGARDVVGERAAVERLNQISRAENEYLAAHGEYGTLEQLVQNGYLEKVSDDDRVTARYSYIVKAAPKTDGRPAAYHANADSRTKDNYIFIPAWRHFYIGSDVKEIRVSDSGPAAAGDPPLNP